MDEDLLIALPPTIPNQRTGGGGAQGGGRSPSTPVLRGASTKRSAPSPTVAPQLTGGGGTQMIPLRGSTQVSDLIPAGPVGGGIPGLNTTTITPESTLRNQRLNFDLSTPTLDTSGFNVSAPGIDSGQRLQHNIPVQSVMENALEAFRAQLPLLNENLADEADVLAGRTSALGRTGSGLFNRATNELSDRARATRESLLGNLGFQGASTDASNRLQAAINAAQLREAQEGRFQQGSIAGAQNALQAALANQSTGLQGQLFNANQAFQSGLERLGLAERQQAREDALASQAQNDLATQLGLLGQGFSGQPSGTDLSGAGSLAQLAGLFGGNAAATGGQIGQAGGSLAELIAGQAGRGGGGIPAAPPPIDFRPPPIDVASPGIRI